VIKYNKRVINNTVANVDDYNLFQYHYSDRHTHTQVCIKLCEQCKRNSSNALIHDKTVCYIHYKRRTNYFLTQNPFRKKKNNDDGEKNFF